MAELFDAVVGYLVLAPFLSDLVFGAVFGVIAGAMVFLSLDELLPAARHYAKGHEAVYGMVIGMAVLAISPRPLQVSTTFCGASGVGCRKPRRSFVLWM